MNDYFYIENLGTKGLWVIVLTSENTSVYWRELEEYIAKNHWANVDVHFDFLYRNGFKNRFFKTTVNEDSRFVSQLQKWSCDRAIVTDRFFSQNLQLLDGSVLSFLQKRMYVNRICLR